VRVSRTVLWEGEGEIPLPDPIGLNSKMAKQNPWIFGILGVGIFLYLAWNNFEIPFAPWTKTAETTAEITGNALGYGPKGMGFTQIITISYLVDDSVYVQKKKLSQRIDKKEIGSKVLIEYAVRDPGNFEIKGFLKH
jgi:hypothetical protein